MRRVMSVETMTDRKPFRVTGWTVLWGMIAFFGVITIANVIMIWLALSSYTGIEAKNPYEAGRTFNASIAAAKAQRAANWEVNADWDRADQRLAVNIRDENGVPISGLDVAVRFRNPIAEMRDQDLQLEERETGLYKAATPALENGQWDLVIEARRGDALAYTSRNRFTLQ